MQDTVSHSVKIANTAMKRVCSSYNYMNKLAKKAIAGDDERVQDRNALCTASRKFFARQ